jgi:hypothetical protein
MLSTRSVGMSLARRFNAGGKYQPYYDRRVATLEIGICFSRRYATKTTRRLVPALKRRAKLIPSLRAENRIQIN